MAKTSPKLFRKLYALFGAIIGVQIATLIYLASRGRDFQILNPAGTISQQQHALLIFAACLSLVIIVPVFLLTFIIVWRYRDTKPKGAYRPNWDGNKKLEAVWWGIPALLITILAVVTFRTSHSLDPYKPINHNKQTITIQVVALEWKWLFMYPDQHIATINHVTIPRDTPVKFVITSDAAMNSFWIPKLGGQIYAMTGMQTTLNLMASKTGTYTGSSANLSGEGFAGMKFDVSVVDNSAFETWATNTKRSPYYLDDKVYQVIQRPTSNELPRFFGSYDHTLFHTIIASYTGKSQHMTTGGH